ncbi:hypothetical protein QM806_04550 [Rhodococcus sp. IEGM 1351]|uniref:hypothetical protein n=1 Tax=Rhodococcus sp. IEGM 1351 TaxID=3047089 RepID=UPI0024B6513A|nr:hypothetical protein [Rhodococcus sp. IEGM 1351]MDI9934725.1 hypothetical protein [Rhodococcus sp. IEGM 1351]
MSNFKVGDEVIGLPSASRRYGTTTEGWRGVVTAVDGEHIFNARGDEVTFTGLDDRYFILLKEGAARMARSTYKLIRDLPELKKGAIVQEKCDDGDQDYTVLDASFIKYEDENGRKSVTYPRKAVEDEPKYFVEVFPVEPNYMTREELDQWKAFQAKTTSVRKTKLAVVGDAAPNAVVTPTNRRTKGHSLESFVRIYNSSRSPRSVAAKTGMAVTSVYARACAARKAGHTLKTMKRAKTAA